MAGRLKAMGQVKYQVDGDPRTSGPGFGLTLHPDVLDLPRGWARPRMIFVNSMSDLFHPKVPLDYVRQVFEVMADTPRHTYQILTKRSKRLADLAGSLPWPGNVWMGVSIETQAYAFRADHLRAVPAAVRMLSLEPLLAPVELELNGIDWVIAGGESGPGLSTGRRGMDHEHPRCLRSVPNALLLQAVGRPDIQDEGSPAPRSDLEPVPGPWPRQKAGSIVSERREGDPALRRLVASVALRGRG